MSGRKSRPRTLVVDGQRFAWLLWLDRADAASWRLVVEVRAADASERSQHLRVRARFEDPWLRGRALPATALRPESWAAAPETPARVTAWIRRGLAQGWTPDQQAPDLWLAEPSQEI